jgi:hypothetical protein
MPGDNSRWQNDCLLAESGCLDDAVQAAARAAVVDPECARKVATDEDAGLMRTSEKANSRGGIASRDGGGRRPTRSPRQRGRFFGGRFFERFRHAGTSAAPGLCEHPEAILGLSLRDATNAGLHRGGPQRSGTSHTGQASVIAGISTLYGRCRRRPSCDPSRSSGDWGWY